MTVKIRFPLLFVFLWSSAYIALEHCAAYVEPATFVVFRASITASVLLFIALIMKIDWPKSWQKYLHSSIVGILIHGVYGTGIFAAIYHGIDVVVCALILSLQPLLTVVLSSLFLAEKLTTKRLIGILLGLLGVLVVILEGGASTVQLMFQNRDLPGAGISLFSLSLCCFALLGISGATILQKRFCSDTHPIAGTCIQNIATAIVILPIAFVFESMQINWNLSFILGLGWLVIFVSIGAMSLLVMLIKQGEVGSVASLLYLVTPMVAIEAWILFGDEVTVSTLIGMLMCMTGVIVVNYISPVRTKNVTTQPQPNISQ